MTLDALGCIREHRVSDLLRHVAANESVGDPQTSALEVCGGVACLDEFGLIRHHNDVFVTRVGEGSNFALKDLIVRPLRKS